MRKYLGYLACALAILAGARGVANIVIVFLALGVTLLFAQQRRNVDIARPSAGKQNSFLDRIYFFGVQLLIMFVCYLIGVFAASSAGEMFGMFLSGRRSLAEG